MARGADASRLTIYYQFKSCPGLLEALYDHLAMRGGMQRMPEVFREPDQSFESTSPDRTTAWLVWVPSPMTSSSPCTQPFRPVLASCSRLHPWSQHATNDRLSGAVGIL